MKTNFTSITTTERVCQRSLGEPNGVVVLDSVGEDELEYRRLSLELLSESLLALRIQLLRVGDNDNLSNELDESRFFLLDRVEEAASKSRPVSSDVDVVVRERREADDDEALAAEEEEEEDRVARCEVLLLRLVGALAFTPFSNRCSGQGFWIACAIS